MTEYQEARKILTDMIVKLLLSGKANIWGDGVVRIREPGSSWNTLFYFELGFGSIEVLIYENDNQKESVHLSWCESRRVKKAVKQRKKINDEERKIARENRIVAILRRHLS